jgi:putative sterol carrier protein
MARFLSPAWAEEFAAALAGLVVPGPGPEAGLGAADGRFTVVEEVRGAPEGDVRLVLCIDGGTIGLRLVGPSSDAEAGDLGEDDAADVTIALSYADAAALARGEVDPAQALNAGRIRVRGDLSVLVAAQQMLDAARAALPDVDATTTY